MKAEWLDEHMNRDIGMERQEILLWEPLTPCLALSNCTSDGYQTTPGNWLPG